MTLPALYFDPDPAWPVPDEVACLTLWDKYAMLPNVRAHSRAVADTALYLADTILNKGIALRRDMVLAAALLHDLAKTYCIRYGGGHDQLGAVWVLAECGNPALAQAVLYHVDWPWFEGELAPAANPFRLPLIISWADKRVRHDEVVSLQERFEDLMARYGKTERSRAHLIRHHQQAKELEGILERVYSGGWFWGICLRG